MMRNLEIDYFKAMPILFLVLALLGNSGSQVNSCYISHENYLGLGSSDRLDSTIQNDEQVYWKKTYLYDNSGSPVNLVWNFINKIDSITVNKTQNYNLTGKVLILTDSTIQNGAAYFYLGINYRIDSVVEKIGDSITHRQDFEYLGDTIFNNNYYSSGSKYTDTTIYTNFGKVSFSGSGGAGDTCQSINDTCYCKRNKYFVQQGRVVYIEGVPNSTYKAFWSDHNLAIRRQKKNILSGKGNLIKYYLINGRSLLKYGSEKYGSETIIKYSY